MPSRSPILHDRRHLPQRWAISWATRSNSRRKRQDASPRIVQACVHFHGRKARKSSSPERGVLIPVSARAVRWPHSITGANVRAPSAEAYTELIRSSPMSHVGRSEGLIPTSDAPSSNAVLVVEAIAAEWNPTTCILISGRVLRKKCRQPDRYPHSSPWKGSCEVHDAVHGEGGILRPCAPPTPARPDHHPP